MKMQKRFPFELLAGGFPPPQALWEDEIGMLKVGRTSCQVLDWKSPEVPHSLRASPDAGFKHPERCSHQGWCWDVSSCLKDFTPGTSPLPSPLLCPQLGHSSSKANLWEILLLPGCLPTPYPPSWEKLPLVSHPFFPPRAQAVISCPISVPLFPS